MKTVLELETILAPQFDAERRKFAERLKERIECEPQIVCEGDVYFGLWMQHDLLEKEPTIKKNLLEDCYNNWHKLTPKAIEFYETFVKNGFYEE